MFDLQAARKAGYGDDEIASYLAESKNFDLPGALKAGYSHAEIVDHLVSKPTGEETGDVPQEVLEYRKLRPDWQKRATGEAEEPDFSEPC